IDLEEDGTTEEADAYKKELETYLNIINALDMDGDISFIATMIAELGKAENYSANEGDDNYMILKTFTNGDFQDEEFATNYFTLLGENLSVEMDEANKTTSWNSYFEKQFLKSGLDESERESFTPGMTEEKFKEELKNNSELADKYGYEAIKPENLWRVACKMYTAMYVAEALAGKDLDPLAVNQALIDNGIYAPDVDNPTSVNMLYTEEYMKAIELLADNKFDITLEKSQVNALTFEQIIDLQNSNDLYFIHIRYEGHSELISSFELGLESSYAESGYLDKVNTTNSWQYLKDQSIRSMFLARTELYPNEIARWDIFKVTPVDDPLANYYHNLIP
ncbi:MAG: hypothetical protein PF518_15525, partial [Spirochaetaceae bacterium]|nr:hypothetical protein [Spirochaetaceae bacterium]